MAITLEQALALPTHHYKTMAEIPIDPKEVISADMWTMVITNATSSHPIAHTGAILDCLGIVIENVANHTVTVAHASMFKGSSFKHAIDASRRRPSDKLRIHLIGGQYDNDRQQEWVKDMQEVLEIFNQTPNAELKTFDVGNKPHPAQFACVFDKNQNVSIVAVTPLVTSLKHCEDEIYGGCYSIPINGRDIPIAVPKVQIARYDDINSDNCMQLGWDGRLPENQRQGNKSDRPAANAKNSSKNYPRI